MILTPEGREKLRAAGRKGGGTKPKSPRGFAYLALHDPERLKTISTKAGKSPKNGKKHL